MNLMHFDYGQTQFNMVTYKRSQGNDLIRNKKQNEIENKEKENEL